MFFTVEHIADKEETKQYFNFEHQKYVHDITENFILPESWIDKFIVNKSKVFFIFCLFYF
jgi:hypothetical protein